MSPTKKALIVVLGGMAVMVIATVCGAAVGFSMSVDSDEPGQYALNWLVSGFWGGAIGTVVGGLLWGLLGYMVCREKKPPKLPPGPPSS